MPARAPQPTNDRWCDVDGTHISLFCQVEQVAERAERGVLPSRLHQQGQVAGWGLNSLYVRFDDNQVVSLPPQLLRLIPDTPGEC